LGIPSSTAHREGRKGGKRTKSAAATIHPGFFRWPGEKKGKKGKKRKGEKRKDGKHSAPPRGNRKDKSRPPRSCHGYPGSKEKRKKGGGRGGPRLFSCGCQANGAGQKWGEGEKKKKREGGGSFQNMERRLLEIDRHRPESRGGGRGKKKKKREGGGGGRASGPFMAPLRLETKKKGGRKKKGGKRRGEKGPALTNLRPEFDRLAQVLCGKKGEGRGEEKKEGGGSHRGPLLCTSPSCDVSPIT